MANSKISVIIPIYDVEKYLRKCLDSVINQTYKNLEIICINDGSPDNCGEILKEYSQKDERIVVITQENSGVSAARNKGIEIAKGQYIAFVDSDDFIEPECYELAIKEFENDPEIDLVSFGVNVISIRPDIDNENKSMQNWMNLPFAGKMLFNEDISVRFTGSPTRVLFKSSLIKDYNIKFLNYKVTEDTIFIYSYLSNVKNIYFIENQLYNYTLRPNSALTKYSPKYNFKYSISNFVKAVNEILNFYKKENKLELFNEIIFRRFLNLILYSLKFANRSNIDYAINELNNLTSFLDDSLDWGKEINWIKNKEFYRFKELKIPYITLGNKIFGLEYYRTEKPHVTFKILAAKISLNCYKLFYLKNNKDGIHKDLNILGLKLQFKRKP